MRKEDCFYLGRIFNKFSFKGELLIKLDSDDAPQSYTELESVFIDMSGTLVPFFIEKCRPYKTGSLRIKFEDIDDEETADSMVKRELYLPMEMLPQLEEGQFYYHQVIGYEVTDESYGSVGILKSVNDRGVQPMFEIDANGSEVLVPLHDDFIKNVDHDKKEILLNCPEGLIELYLD